MLTNQEIDSMFAWGAWEIITTKFGERQCRRKKACERDIQRFQSNKLDLSTAGVQLQEFPPMSGKYQLTQWRKVETEEMARHKLAERLSDSTQSHLVVPSPPGMTFMPFQMASIHFFLNGLGVDCSKLIPGSKPHPAAFPGLFGMPMIPMEQRRTGFLLGDAPGLGKSCQSVGFINACNALGGGKKIGKVLYICPAGLKLNAARELGRWLTHKYSIGIADGQVFPSAEIVIINYQILHKWENRLAQMWDLMIVDEAHFLRTGTARMTQAAYGGMVDGVRKAGIPARIRLAMSGTPLENRPKEFWETIHWLDPITWNDKGRFEYKYCGGGYGTGWTNKGSSHELELQKKLRSTLMARRLKRDVMKDLPPKRREVILLPNDEDMKLEFETEEMKSWADRMSTARARVEWMKSLEDQKLYDEAVQQLQEAIDSGQAASAEARQAAARKKLLMVIPILKEAQDSTGKIIVFAYHREIIEKLAKELPGSLVIYGGIEAQKRDELVQRFQNDPTVTTIILSIPVAVGMTLTASSHEYFVESDWRPGRITQAEDRCIAKGQPILTVNGWMKIEDICVGDFVIDHNGNSSEVVDVWSSWSKRTMTEIVAEGWCFPIVTTSDHRMLTASRGWIDAGQLSPGDRLKMPTIYNPKYDLRETQEMDFPESCRISDTFIGSNGVQRNGRLIKAPAKIQVTDDFLFACGYFAGDGFASVASGKGRFMSFSGNTGKKVPAVARCRKWATSIGLFTSEDRPSSEKGTETRSYSGEWAKFFSIMFGEKASGKRLPEWILSLNARQSEIVLEGLIASDGYVRNGRSEYATVSDVLAANVATLMMRCGKRPCVTRPQQAGGWVIAFSGSDKSQDMLVRSVLTRFPKKEGDLRERVYDITVKGASSFVVGMAVAHNCHRIGQRDSVNVYHFVLENSVDVVMIDSVLRKQAMIDACLDEDESRGREKNEPVIPVPGFSTTFKEVAVESLKTGHLLQQTQDACREQLKKPNGLTEYILLDGFMRVSKPWPKLVGLINLLLRSMNAPKIVVAPQQKPVTVSNPPRDTAPRESKGSQVEMTLA